MADGLSRFVGTYDLDLPAGHALRIVAGAIAPDAGTANGCIHARLQQHGITRIRCEGMATTQDWSHLFPNDPTGACFDAALTRPLQVSFLDHLLALPPRSLDPDLRPDAACLTSAHLPVSPLPPRSRLAYPEGLAQLFDTTDGAACYALLDGAAVANLPTLIETSGLEYHNLFRGAAAQDLQDVSPWLVRLTPGTRFTRHLFTQDPRTPWMLWSRIEPVLLRSTDSLDQITAHFRRLTRVRAESDGRWLFFRFYTAQTLMQLRSVLQEDDAKALFGPYALIAMTGQGGCHLSLKTPPASGNDRPKRPFILRDSYMRALEQQRMLRFRADLIKDLQASNPALDQGQAQILTDTALDFCQGVGLTQKDSVAGYALLSAHMGRDFILRDKTMAFIRDPRHSERARKTFIHNALGKV